MEQFNKYIEIYTIKIPYYVFASDKSICNALEHNDINLVKSLIAYKNYIKKIKKDFDKI